MARALLLTGSVGSGKTTVLMEIGERLGGTRHALIDLDWLCWVEGMDVRAALERNLAAVWATYRAAGIDQLVLSRFVESAASLAAIRAALPGVELFVVQLVVAPAELEARLRGRDRGAELATHLELMAEPGVAGDAQVANRVAADAAREALTLAGW